MLYAFVRFVEVGDGGEGNVLITLAQGEEAKSQQDFIDSCKRGVYGQVRVINWFGVPENWRDAHVGDEWTELVFDALLKLDVLSQDEQPTMKLFVTIFEAGFKCGEEHARR